MKRILPILVYSYFVVILAMLLNVFDRVVYAKYVCSLYGP